jgi:phenylpropionate dioxygenase-like ring-hydroxylating dioxygenase large terminal subunit
MIAYAAAPVRESAGEAPKSFHQCWYRLGLTSEVPVGQVVGYEFLSTRVVLCRDAAGKIVARSA